jgi:glycogen phosphorylase
MAAAERGGGHAVTGCAFAVTRTFRRPAQPWLGQDERAMNNEPGVLPTEADRTEEDPRALAQALQNHLYYTCGEDELSATPLDYYLSLAHVVRDRLMHRWLETRKAYYEQDVKRVYYLSAEFMLGRSLASHLKYLGIYEAAEQVFERGRLSLGEILELEAEPGLGNGGLGRLAACYLDSMASLSLPGYGYGIRYEYGIFEQTFENGWQVERRDTWLRHGNPWEIPRPQYTVEVPLYGRVEESTDESGRLRVRWLDTDHMLGAPYDMLVPGYGTNTCNSLRLWSARGSREFNLQLFNSGDFRRAVEDKVTSETVSKVLYPVDHTPEGKELRLKQQYFFTFCSIHDLLRRYKAVHADLTQFADKIAIQLNDTHPAIAVAELMRRFVDGEGLNWDAAWSLCQRTFGFTNHTLLPEALERWPVAMFGRLLPRHLQIILEINRRLLRDVQIFAPGDSTLQRALSIIEEGPEQRVRMAHLAVVGSHSVNGVAALHTELLKTSLFRDFARMWPERFNNKTNGVTPRRFLLVSNPTLSGLIERRIGRGWISDLAELERLVELGSDEGFLSELADAKRVNKERLAALVHREVGVELISDAMFVVQVKRMHEYKRQLLNCLYLISEYQRLRASVDAEGPSRVFIFGGKAAPGYQRAKLIIKLINEVAAVVNADPRVNRRLCATFLPNYDVSMAELIMPAADLSVQISLAGTEASGTGNMKLMMNGALTIGTRDGANIEIEQAVGSDACFSFGLSADEVAGLQRKGYDPASFIANSPRLRSAIELMDSGLFAPSEPGIFRELIENLWHGDPYMVCADFDAYLTAQELAGQRFADPRRWQRDSLLNIAHSGTFSSDRAIRQYADEIWGLSRVPL